MYRLIHRDGVREITRGGKPGRNGMLKGNAYANHQQCVTHRFCLRSLYEVLIRACRDTKCLSVNKHTDQSMFSRFLCISLWVWRILYFLELWQREVWVTCFSSYVSRRRKLLCNVSRQSDCKFKISDRPTLMKGSDVQVHMSLSCHGPGLNSHLTRSWSFRLYAFPDLLPFLVMPFFVHPTHFRNRWQNRWKFKKNDLTETFEFRERYPTYRSRPQIILLRWISNGLTEFITNRVTKLYLLLYWGDTINRVYHGDWTHRLLLNQRQWCTS
jgi:hypothetical protein